LFRSRRFARLVLTLIAAGAVALAVAGCGYLKQGSLAVSQPEGIGSVRVHFAICTIGGSQFCGPNEETATVQYLLGIAVPPGATPPATFTATPQGAGAPIVFTRSEEVAPELAAASASEQKLFSEPHSAEEKAEFEAAQKLLGTLWPPSGLQGIGYISAPVSEVENNSAEWTIDADFGLPTTKGAPFAGPFGTGIAIGLREIGEKTPANRAVHCFRFEIGSAPQEGDALCSSSVLQGQLASNDLRVEAPTKPVSAFVGGSGQISFPLEFAGGSGSVSSFALSATTTAKGGKAKTSPTSFAPKIPNSTTHLSPKGTGKVTVSLPRGIKPGTYKVTLTAKAPQGGTATGVAKLKVTKPTLKLSGAKPNKSNGTATLKVKVPGAGKLTIGGSGVVPVKLKVKSKKAKTVKVTIAASGAAGAQLAGSGSAKLKVKATFKPTSGISVSKSKSIVLKLG
jgi:hypothetical protein